jgi:hypothetical protein
MPRAIVRWRHELDDIVTGLDCPTFWNVSL